MSDAAAAERALCDPAREVSCHWLVARDGSVDGARGRRQTRLALPGRAAGEVARTSILARSGSNWTMTAPRPSPHRHGRARAPAGRYPRAVRHSRLWRDRTFRHGTGPKTRPRTPLRLAQARPGRPRGLARAGRIRGAPGPTWQSFGPTRWLSAIPTWPDDLLLEDRAPAVPPGRARASGRHRLRHTPPRWRMLDPIGSKA